VEKSILLVDGNPERRQSLEGLLALRARVEVCSGFAAARQRLLTNRPHMLVTSSRLGPYNGLHLAHMAASFSLITRVIVYGDDDRVAVAREAQVAGAFFVPGHQIATALPAYLDAELPPHDRRDAVCADRRHLFRGGRRTVDSDRPARPLGPA
jgi:hypothetical protein